jgi:hypothetical protein
MAICCQPWTPVLERGKSRAEIVSETVGDTAQAEHSKFVSKFGMNGVDVIVEVYSCDAAEFGVTQPDVESEYGAKREKQRDEITQAVLTPNYAG